VEGEEKSTHTPNHTSNYHTHNRMNYYPRNRPPGVTHSDEEADYVPSSGDEEEDEGEESDDDMAVIIAPPAVPNVPLAAPPAAVNGGLAGQPFRGPPTVLTQFFMHIATISCLLCPSTQGRGMDPTNRDGHLNARRHLKKLRAAVGPMPADPMVPGPMRQEVAHMCNWCSICPLGYRRDRYRQLAPHDVGIHLASADHRRRTTTNRYELFEAAHPIMPDGTVGRHVNDEW